LEALDVGIAVQRHWPLGKTFFIQLYSDDKGDIICCRYIPDDEVVVALATMGEDLKRRHG
jgi:hypothetical protein